MARKLALNLALFLVSMSALALLLVVVAANSNQADSMSLISANESVNPVADCCQNKSLSMRPPVPTPVNFSEMNFTLSRNDSFFDILNEAMIRRSWVWNETSCKPGLAASFCRVLQRLDQGQCLNIQVLGGSTTLGRRVPSRDLFWYVQLETWLNKKFPCGGLKHRVGVHATSGATSANHLGDLHLINAKFKAMNGELDLILLEIGVNDYLGKYAPATEALVYSLLEVQPKASIIMLSCLPRADELQKLPEAVNHLPLSLHLHTPFISIPHALLTTPPRNNTAASSLFTELKNVTTSVLFLQLGQAGGLWPDGSHLSADGHAWLAFSIAMFFVEMIPRVRGMDLSHIPAAVDVASLWEHVRLPEARALKLPNSVTLVQSFIDTTPPKGLYLPKGWTHQNENERYGLIAFGVCNASSSTLLDPCSEPLSVEIGANTFVLTILRSYEGLGMVMVEAPSSMTFDVCETPLTENSQQCVLDGIFDEKAVLATFSWPVHIKMHLVPRTEAPKFPLNLTIHILPPALSHNMTPPNHTYWIHHNGSHSRLIGFPERQNEKTKIGGWYSYHS